MKTNENGVSPLYLTIDLIILNLSIVTIILITQFENELNYRDMSLFMLHGSLSWVITYSIYSYKSLYIHNYFSNRVKRINNRIAIFIIVSFLLAQLFLPRTSSRLFLLEYTALFYVCKLIVYFFIYRFLKYLRAKGIYMKKAIIIGSNDMSIFLRRIINSNPVLGYEFVGYITEEPEMYKKDVLGQLNNLETLIKKYQTDILFVTSSTYSDSTKSTELLTTCNKLGVRLRFVPENQYWFKFRKSMESVGSFAIVNPLEIPLDDLNLRLLKRIFDIFFSTCVILFIISWLFPIIMLSIKLSSKGPVFFRQQRTGINNKTFTCLKFRSMCINNDSDSKQATKNDSRLTSLGHFLRRSNLDELPQFFNVFLGQMSIVGPRPHMLKHTEEYSDIIENYRVRHYIKPGITGWAQVNGYRGITDELWKMEKRVEYDMVYLENWSLWWDIRIIFMTILGNKTQLNAM
jgi:putative colanic acid biosysnthesis UDP-glucose lipid carrier transferase